MSACPSQRLADLAYTLCVSTGTREITDALNVACVARSRAVLHTDTRPNLWMVGRRWRRVPLASRCGGRRSSSA
ncbi:DUF5133 domain-containing protein [Streptomyces sp. NPDC001185]|uniref:DUF5133 domain-containing protein n=1 Tax=Streptomyces sp. NPDC001185 TaxID=3154380 RepID=UPI00332EA81B